jgi:transposase
MGKRQLQLTEKENSQFREAEAQTRDVYELKRLQAIRLYGSGIGIAEIQEMVGAGESTIRQWAMAYRAAGLAGLRSKWHGKNANKLRDEEREQIKQRLHQYRPVDLHLSTREYWTVSDLRIAVEQWFGVIYRDETSYQILLHKSGFSYQRTTKIYRSRPGEVALANFEAELEKK